MSARRPEPPPPFACDFDEHFVGQACDMMMREIRAYLRGHLAFARYLDQVSGCAPLVWERRRAGMYARADGWKVMRAGRGRWVVYDPEWTRHAVRSTLRAAQLAAP